MSQKPNIAMVAHPQEFFRELITDALKHQKVKTQPEIEFYLVNLLNHFMVTDRLFIRDAEGNMKEEPLALLLKEAIEEPKLEAQKILFRHVGDVSLYVAGYFQESLHRKLVNVDYYIDVGGTAYSNIANRVGEPTFKELYLELANRFSTFVDVLAEVSEKTGGQKTEVDLLKIYDRWIQTKSDRALKALKDAGILPNTTIKKNIQ